MSFIPFIVLILLITCCVAVFGNATLEGASQVSLLVASAVSVLIGHFSKRLKWEVLEQEITNKVASCTPAIIILLLIGAIGGTWMVSGTVPTMIYYGMQMIRPEVFLVSSSLLCALVSLMIGSSWTTIGTIGLALMGIGKAHGFDDGWIAGSIITGAYFGDKLSPLSDTTVLASSVSGVPLFSHIRYMLYTTVPTFCLSLIIFFVAGFVMNVSGQGNVLEFMEGLERTFVISPWLLLVPVLTGIMIARRCYDLGIHLYATKDTARAIRSRAGTRTWSPARRLRVSWTCLRSWTSWTGCCSMSRISSSITSYYRRC